MVAIWWQSQMPGCDDKRCDLPCGSLTRSRSVWLSHYEFTTITAKDSRLVSIPRRYGKKGLSHISLARSIVFD